MNKIVVPPHCKVGDDAELECSFAMQGEPLYSVKWYKDGDEFFRYIPGDRDQTVTVFKLPGVNVDVSMKSVNRWPDRRPFSATYLQS